VAGKVPTRSPTHEDVPMARLASMGMELDDIADDGKVTLPALVELAEDRGRPASHYIASIPLASELSLVCETDKVSLRVCAGNCQRYGALDLLDHLVERSMAKGGFAIIPLECLDRCDHGPAIEVDGAHGKLVLAPATKTSVDEALDAL
jgi:NADH:ubiquinone oxidoreductase subunit E